MDNQIITSTTAESKSQNEVTMFSHERFGELRVVIKDQEPWFVAADVCKSLDVGNVSMALARLDNDEKGVSSVDTLGGIQQMSIVSEPGLYALALKGQSIMLRVVKQIASFQTLKNHPCVNTNAF